MKVGIVGAGAIGMLFGSYLSDANHEITFLVRNREIEEVVYIEKELKEKKVINCSFVYEMALLHSMDLIIIAVKFHHLENLKEELNSLPVHIPLLFIQNGLLHLPFIDQLNQRHIAIGSVLHGASKVNGCTVRHLGVGATTVGVYKGDSSEGITTLLQSSTTDFPVETTDAIERVLFRKAVLNCLINPLTTIAGVKNGELVKNESYLKIMKNMYEEMMAVFEECRESLSWLDVVSLCENTQNNRSSMLSDYESGRLMEIDTIVGAIISKADTRGKKLPILQTFYMLLKEMNKAGDPHH